MEMVDPVEAEIDEIMALDALDLEKEEDDTDHCCKSCTWNVVLCSP